MADNNKKKRSLKAFLQNKLKSRSTRHGAMALGFAALAVAAAILLNVIAGLLSDRFPGMKADFTANQAYALSDDTTEYIRHMDKDVALHIIADESTFTGGGRYFVQAKNLLDKMVSASDGKFTYDFVDTTENPAFTRNYPNIDWSQRDKAGVITCGNQYRALSIDDCFTYDTDYYQQNQQYVWTGTTIEQAVVKGALYVTDDNKVQVAMLTGEGEDKDEYSALSSLLTDNAYEVKETSLITDGLDDSFAAAVMFAPHTDISEKAAGVLRTWLENGGKYGKTLIVMPTSQALNIQTPNLNALLSEWGMAVNEGYVYETNTHYVWGRDLFEFIVEYTDYYFDTLTNVNVPVAAEHVHGVTIKDSSTAHAILQTTDQAGIMPVDAGSDFSPTDNLAGEPVAVAAEGVKSGVEESSRVVVFSGSAMFDRSVLAYPSFNNSTFFINMLNTIADKDDNTVVIQTKSLETPTLGAPSVATTNVILIAFVFVIPVAVLAVAVVLWARRRNR